MSRPKLYILVFIAAWFAFSSATVRAQQAILQGFFWDFSTPDSHHEDYYLQWANYLADLSPRLAAIGLDGVWIPSTCKEQIPGNGYTPFDHYDLGDKYQKGYLRTAMGTKDELLRMVAVMHANGLQVIQDVVLNHMDGAGSQYGHGAIDPEALDVQQKNFRYACWATPANNEDAIPYLSREGRFPKNWQNFNPNPAQPDNTGDLYSHLWGPDISYVSGAYGLSSNAEYNPNQTSEYMLNGMRDWMVWHKKQIGYDGYRVDAVKHFPTSVTADFFGTVQENADWASGTATMFAVGEFVGWKDGMDPWITANGGRVGTFDFALRLELVELAQQFGTNYDIRTAVGAQQDVNVLEFEVDGQPVWVHRSSPLINNHDTFRPNLDDDGNYESFKEPGDDFGPIYPTIDPRNGRLSQLYAIAFALDGSPVVFFEDLFDIGTNSNRFTHNPADPEELPMRADIANIIECHKRLDFKNGILSIKWEQATEDHIVIERMGKALIGVNDAWDDWQAQWVPTSFASGTELIDYSGASSDVLIVNEHGWVEVKTPPAGGVGVPNERKGYAIWAPAGATLNMPARATTQEWEMADDLGDSHSNSLQQGGALQPNSLDYQTTGKIFAAEGEQVEFTVYTENADEYVRIAFFDENGTQIHTQQGKGILSGSFSVNYQDWTTIKVRNGSSQNQGQRVWVKMTYQGPIDRTVIPPLAVGMDDLKSPENLVFPNPIRMGEELQLNAPLNAVTDIFDTRGRWMMQVKGNRLPALSLRPGVYFLENSFGSQKLVVK